MLFDHDNFGVLGVRWTRSRQRHLYTRLLRHMSTTVTPYWQVHQRSRLTSFKECSTLLLASLPVPQVRLGPAAAAAHRAALARHTWASNIQLGVIMFGCQHGWAPQYLIDYCLPVSDVASWRHLRSANRRLLVVHRLRKYDRRAFAVAGPTAWNSPGSNLCDPDLTTDHFKRLLKMFLFSACECK